MNGGREMLPVPWGEGVRGGAGGFRVFAGIN